MSEPTLWCSCGRNEDHIVARTYTSDLVRIELWSDGCITGRIGQYPQGLGRTTLPGRDLRAARLVWADLCLYDWSELAAIVKLARRAIDQTTVEPRSFLRRALQEEVDKPRADQRAAARARGER